MFVADFEAMTHGGLQAFLMTMQAIPDAALDVCRKGVMMHVNSPAKYPCGPGVPKHEPRFAAR